MAIVLIFFRKTPVWTTTLLAGLWVLLAIPVLHTKFVTAALRGWHKVLNTGFALLLVTAGVASFGLNVWPETGLSTMSDKDRDELIAKLKTEAHPWPVKLMCPPNDEKDCVVASQFVYVFGMAGWPMVHQAVDREMNGVPHAGLYFVLHSTADIDYNDPVFRKPGVGVWTETPTSYYVIKNVLDKLGIKSEMVVGTAFPEHTLGMYFGVGTAKQ